MAKKSRKPRPKSAQIRSMLDKGMANKEIAAKLKVSPSHVSGVRKRHNQAKAGVTKGPKSKKPTVEVVTIADLRQVQRFANKIGGEARLREILKILNELRSDPNPIDI